MEDKDFEVSVNMLVVSTLSAFVVGAVLSGLGVCLFSTQQNTNIQHKQKDKDTNLILEHPVNSVSRDNDISHQGDNPVFTSFEQNVWNPRNSNKHIGILPTPEQTPQQHKRMINSQDYLNHSLHDPSFSLVYPNVQQLVSSNLPADELYDSQSVHGLQTEDSHYIPLHYLPLKEDDPKYLAEHGEKMWHFHHYSNDSYCIPHHGKDSGSSSIPLEENKYGVQHRSNSSYLCKRDQERSAKCGKQFHSQSSQGYDSKYFPADFPFHWSSSQHRCGLSAPTSDIVCKRFSLTSPLRWDTHLKRNLTFNGGDISSTFSNTAYMYSEPPHSMTTASDLKLMVDYRMPRTSSDP